MLLPCESPQPSPLRASLRPFRAQVARQGRFSDYPEVGVESSWDKKATDWLAEPAVQKIVLRKSNTRNSKLTSP